MLPSNPYLNFSRNWGVDYGDVLSFISAYEKKFKDLTFWERKACKELQLTASAKALLELRRQVRIEIFKDEEEINKQRLIDFMQSKQIQSAEQVILGLGGKYYYSPNTPELLEVVGITNPLDIELIEEHTKPGYLLVYFATDLHRGLDSQINVSEIRNLVRGIK